MITGVRTHQTIDPRNIQLLVQTFWKHIWTQHSSENWNCHNPILCNQATRECLQMIPLTKKIMGKMASMVCFLPLQRVPALCLLGQEIREQVILHNSSKFRFVWKCSHFTKFQTSFVIAVAVATVQLVDTDTYISSLRSISQRLVAHTTSEALDMIVQTKGFNYHGSSKTQFLWTVWAELFPTDCHDLFSMAGGWGRGLGVGGSPRGSQTVFWLWSMTVAVIRWQSLRQSIWFSTELFGIQRSRRYHTVRSISLLFRDGRVISPAIGQSLWMHRFDWSSMDRMTFIVGLPPSLRLLHHPMGVWIVLLWPVWSAGAKVTATGPGFWHRIGMIHFLCRLWLCLSFGLFLQWGGFSIHGQHVLSGPSLLVLVWIGRPQLS